MLQFRRIVVFLFHEYLEVPLLACCALPHLYSEFACTLSGVWWSVLKDLAFDWLSKGSPQIKLLEISTWLGQNPKYFQKFHLRAPLSLII